MAEELIDKNVAEADVNQWLESMDISPEMRKSDGAKDAVDRLVLAVQKGNLVFNGDETCTQKLKTPLGEKGVTDEIKYDFRFSVKDYMKVTKGVFDNTEMAVSKLSLVGNQPKGVFENMKRSDFVTASALVVFF